MGNKDKKVEEEKAREKEHKEEEKKKNQEERQAHIDEKLENSEPSDENTARSHEEILKTQLEEGQEIYERSACSIFISSVTAGLEIGFSYLLICSLFYFLSGKLAEDTVYKMLTFVYPIGFMMVIGGKSILFTEQTSLLSLPVLNQKRSAKFLLGLWGIVILGNLCGGYIMAIVLSWFGPRMGLFNLHTIEKIADHVTTLEPQLILVSAIIAGWLMGLLSWLLSSAKESISRIVLVFLITGTIAFTGLHHSIVGNVEVFAGLLTSEAITTIDYLSFQSIAILGNALGGFFFVALLKYRAFEYNVD